MLTWFRGTPIPIWASQDLSELVCVGSVAELKELSGFQGDIKDIHRDKIDGITIPSEKGGKPLKRIDEVFDCWFESVRKLLVYPLQLNILISFRGTCHLHKVIIRSRIRRNSTLHFRVTLSLKVLTRLAGGM